MTLVMVTDSLKITIKFKFPTKRKKINNNFLFFRPEAKGWYSHYPAHSCIDIRDSGDSKGDGEYWIDPARSGNPLKVFCDMTTGGG